MMRRERGIHEIFTEDPERADRVLWGRRAFLANIGAMSAVLGARIVYAQHMPAGLIPAPLANAREPFYIEGKDGLTVLNDRPLSAETPAHLLNDDITPTERLFVRNNGTPPDGTTTARRWTARRWTLTVDGESVLRPRRYTIAGPKRRFPHVHRQLVLECAGNGRAGYEPSVAGGQWTLGAVGCPEWNGLLLRDVLDDCGVARNAVGCVVIGASLPRGCASAFSRQTERANGWTLGIHRALAYGGGDSGRTGGAGWTCRHGGADGSSGGAGRT